MSCSFCNNRGHNITRCNSPTIDLLFERMKSMWIDTLNTVDVLEHEAIYSSALNIGFTLRELKAVYVKYTNGYACLAKPNIIYFLYLYFRNRFITIPLSLPQEEQPWLEARRLPAIPDPIPDLEQPAPHEEQEQQEPEVDIWRIDRTPTSITTRAENVGLRQVPVDDRIYLRQLTGGERINVSQFTGGERINLTEIYFSQEHYDRFHIQERNLKYNISPTLLVGEGDNLDKCEDCPICYESTKLSNTVELGCSHKFCSTCVTMILKTHKKICAPSCALCRTTMQSCSVKNKEVYDKIVEYCNM